MLLDTNRSNCRWPWNLSRPGFYLIYVRHWLRIVKLSTKTAPKVLSRPMACVVNRARRVIDAHPLHSIHVSLRRSHSHFTLAIAAHDDANVYSTEGCGRVEAMCTNCIWVINRFCVLLSSCCLYFFLLSIIGNDYYFYYIIINSNKKNGQKKKKKIGGILYRRLLRSLISHMSSFLI